MAHEPRVRIGREADIHGANDDDFVHALEGLAFERVQHRLQTVTIVQSWKDDGNEHRGICIFHASAARPRMRS